MSKKNNLTYLLVCFSFAILVVIPLLEEPASGFMQTSVGLNSTNGTRAATNASVGLNSTNGTRAATNASVSRTMQITSADTKEVTDGESLNIGLQIQPFPVTINANSEFKISFLQPSSQTVQVHIDYDFAILKQDKEIFRASSITGQPLLHTAEGIVTIPYKFDQEGQYLLQISVMGINFIPIKTEQALFELKIS